MANAFDRFAKEFIEEVLAPIAAVKPEHQVETPVQNIDVVVEPNAEVDRAKAFAEFGWLARMIEGPCLLEPYSRTPGVSDLRKCLQRQLAWDSHRARKAERESREAPAYPHLWVLCTGDPKSVTESYELAPRPGWPKGFRFDAPAHAMGVVVLSDLERTRETLLLRLLGRGAVLQDAIVDAHTLDSDELRRRILELLVRRRMVMLESVDSEDRREAAMLEQEFQHFKKVLRAEGRDEGRVEGKAEGKAEAILSVLGARKLGLTDAERSRILSCRDLAQLERWLERAATVVAVSDVFADGSTGTRSGAG